MKKKRLKFWECKANCRDMFMWRAHPEKKKDLEEGRQEHQDEDSESEIEWEGMEKLETFELQNTMIRGCPKYI